MKFSAVELPYCAVRILLADIFDESVVVANVSASYLSGSWTILPSSAVDFVNLAEDDNSPS